MHSIQQSLFGKTSPGFSGAGAMIPRPTNPYAAALIGHFPRRERVRFMPPPKPCVVCQREFHKPTSMGRPQWEITQCCSIKCAAIYAGLKRRGLLQKLDESAAPPVLCSESARLCESCWERPGGVACPHCGAWVCPGCSRGDAPCQRCRDAARIRAEWRTK